VGHNVSVRYEDLIGENINSRPTEKNTKQFCYPLVSTLNTEENNQTLFSCPVKRLQGKILIQGEIINKSSDNVASFEYFETTAINQNPVDQDITRKLNSVMFATIQFKIFTLSNFPLGT
jgi:hypothetical protein